MTLDWLESGVFLRDASEANFDLRIASVTKETYTPDYNNPTSNANAQNIINKLA